MSLRSLLAAVDGSDLATLQRAGARLLDPIRDAIQEAYRAIGPPAVAVRSSATTKDLPEASFAGQQGTYAQRF